MSGTGLNNLPVVTLTGANPRTFEAALSYSDPGATASDVEDGALTPVITANTVVSNVPGTYGVTWTATDGATASASANRVVMVVDTTAPVITVPANVVAESTSPTGATVSYPAATASDEVGVVSLTYSQNSATQFAPGVTTVTVTAKDAANNTSTATFTVTVSDTTAPAITAPANVVAEATGPTGATVNYIAASASDAVGVASLTYSQNSATQFAPGVTTVTVTAKDAVNNTSTATFTVSVSDTTAPAITAPANVVAEATGPTGAIANYAAASASDAVGVTSLTYSQNSGTLFALGPNTVTVTAKDAANNTSTATFTVTVSDTAAPAITAPANVVAEATGPTGATVNYIAASASDAVGVASLTYSQNSGTLFALGPNTVTVTGRDAANNTSTATFTVTVTDTTVPAITVPGDVVVEATSQNGATVNYSAATASDAVGVTSLTYSQDSGTLFALGETTVTVTARDAADHTTLATFKVTVQDTTAPVLTVPEDMIVGSTSANGAFVNFTPTATDGVSTPVIVSTPASGTLFPMGDTTVNVTATDAQGLVSTGSFTVSVQTFAAGSYNGLAIPTLSSTVPGDQVGAITLKVTSSGTFTGKLMLGGTSKLVTVKGAVGIDGGVLFGKAPGTSSLSIVREGKATLELKFTLLAKLTGTLQEAGQVTVSQIEAERFCYTSKAAPVAPLLNVPVSLLNPATDKGKYTVLLQAKTPVQQAQPASGFPQGDGWAQLTVAKTGIVKAVGKLADGTPFSCAQPLSRANQWPFYVALNKGMGSISGVVSFRDLSNQSDADGLDLRWFKPASLTDKTYRDGWGVNGILIDLYASKYVPPTVGSGQSALLLPGNVAPNIAKNASLSFSGKWGSGFLFSQIFIPLHCMFLGIRCKSMFALFLCVQTKVL